MAHERLGHLQDALVSQDLPPYLKDVDILSALVLFTTPEQAAGMVRGYWRYTNSLTDQDDGGASTGKDS
jgi:hypothetical protein